VIVGASFDPVADNRAFAEKFDFPFALLSDESRAMGLAYGAATDPSAEYAARVGVIVGPDGKVVQWHAKVDPRTFPQAALDALP
jgi:peroxiredoxin Q/BCP